MNEKNYFKWDQPKAFTECNENLKKEMTKPNYFFRLLVKLVFKLFHNVSLINNLNPTITVNDIGICSKVNIDGAIKYEEIWHITIEYKKIPLEVKVMTISHYEDLETMIPDITTYGIPENFEINEFNKFIKKKAPHIKIEINV